MTLYDERLARTLNAVHMEPVDKIPFSYNGPAYMAKWAGLTMAQYLTDFKAATDGAIRFLEAHPGVDSIHSPNFTTHALKMLWFSNVGVPGVDIDENELWQVLEDEVMKQEDYQAILDQGYDSWYQDFMVKRLGDPLTDIGGYVEASPTTIQRVAQEAQTPVMNWVITGTPFEGFCGGRQLMNFFMDLLTCPDLVKDALDAAFASSKAQFKAQLDAMNPLAVWVGGWRVAPEMIGPEMFMEFVWPQLEELILMTIDHGVVPVLHFDSNWEGELETLATLPPRKCLLMLDGFTDMRKARDILDDRMCLLGDVPSTMTAFGTPEECYDYVTKLIDDVGSTTGLIVSTGCDAPLNAKDENIDAIIQATVDYKLS